jgi:hypothetical protein
VFLPVDKCSRSVVEGIHLISDVLLRVPHGIPAGMSDKVYTVIRYCLADGSEVATLTYGPAREKVRPVVEPGLGLCLKFWDLPRRKLRRLNALSVVSMRDCLPEQSVRMSDSPDS